MKKISEHIGNHRFPMRGQISIEFIVTVGFALLMIIPLTILLYEHNTKTYEEVNINQGGLIARKITDAANNVYYLGYPSTLTLRVYFPEYISSINISGRELIFNFETGQSAVSTANINLTGKISTQSGLRDITITALENLVNISDETTQ